VDFLEAYEEYVPRVYGYFAYRLRSRADAEDLTQLTFERAFAAWDRFDEHRAELGTWLLTIARNALTDFHRRERSRRHESLSVSSGGREPAGEDDPGPGFDPELADALGRLSRRERGIIALRFGADLSGAQIAEMLGLSVNNVHQILSRALRKLRELLEAEEGVTPRGEGSGRERPGAADA
jgi:RNA polymerase sigma-70 factor (ECF subfamily)